MFLKKAFFLLFFLSLTSCFSTQKKSDRGPSSETPLEEELEDISILDQNDFEFVIKRLDQIIRNYERMKSHVSTLEEQLETIKKQEKNKEFAEKNKEDYELIEPVEENSPIDKKEVKKDKKETENL